MFQPSQTERCASPEADPLLDFFSEQVPASQPTAPSGTASLEKLAQSVQPLQPVEHVAAVDPRDNAIADLRERIERANGLLDRSITEIAALRSDLATLVTTVEDIRKRQGRPESVLPPAARPAPPRMPARRRLLTAVVLLGVATGIWGLIRFAAYEAPKPPAVQGGQVVPASVAAPLVEPVAPPAVEDAGVASATTLAPPPAAAPRADPRPRAEPRVTGYVGTLTVHSDPAGEVFLNREHVGLTPLRLEKLRAGSHLIWIQREGHRRWTRVVPVTAGRVSHVSATLDPVAR